MAITHATATRNAIADQFDSQVNSGTTDAGGDILIISTDGTTTLASMQFSDPAFGTAASGSMSANGLPLKDTSANATGTIASFSIQNRDNSLVLSGSAGSAGTEDITFDNNNVNAGQTVSITALSYTAPT